MRSKAASRVLFGVVLGIAVCACGHGDSHRSGAASLPIPSELNRDVALQVTNIEVRHGTAGNLMPLDDPAKDIDTFDFSGVNGTAKATSSFSATVVLQDQAGHTLYQGTLEDSEIVPPSASFDIRVTVANDTASLPNPELVRSALPAQTRLLYRVQSIGYVDGTKATAAHP